MVTSAAGQPLPDGLLDGLRADATGPVVRPAELARARRRMASVPIDSPVVLEGIATAILEGVPGRVASV